MNKAYQIVVFLLGLAALASFVGCFIANLELVPFLDAERVGKKTGGNGMWYIGSRVTPIEFYREEAWPLWKVRDRFSKAFMISAGLLLVTFIEPPSVEPHYGAPNDSKAHPAHHRQLRGCAPPCLTANVRHKEVMRHLSIGAVFLLSLAGCFSVKPYLWQPRPTEILVQQDIIVPGVWDGASYRVPAGRYLFAHENRIGYYYQATTHNIFVTEKNRGPAIEKSFAGGLLLARTVDGVFVEEISTREEYGKRMHGEVAGLIEMESKEKGEIAWIDRTRIPKELRPKLGLPGVYPRP